LLSQLVQGDRHRTKRQPLGISQRKGTPGSVPELGIEDRRFQRYGTGNGGVIGVGSLDPQPAGGEPPPAKSPPQTFTQQPQYGMKDAEIVGITGQSVSQMEFGLLFRREYRTRIDPSRSHPEHPAFPSEDGTECALWNICDFADALELIVFQPYPHTGLELRQHLERLRGQKLPFIPDRDI
jgi:hypothetical protein